MTKSLATTMVLVALTVSGAALAQTSSAPAAPPAGKEMNRDTNSAGAPVSGANSFTEGEARNRIEKSGYNDVSGLKKDAQGIWHAQAMKDGTPTQVALDYKGNVVPMAQSAQVPAAQSASPGPASGPTR
jgi:hypothetical protein